MSRRRHNELDLKSLPALNPLHYNEDREMIGHDVVPKTEPLEGIYWCSVCDGHPDDPIHQTGYEP